ncbi:alkaline phosphatase family protein, partial [Halobium palmae]
MRRDDLAADLARRRDGDGYVFPAYEDYCFANVPGAVYDLLGVDVGPTLPDDAFDTDATGRADATASAGASAGVGDGVERVVVVLVDGFGYDQWRQHVDAADRGFLPDVEETGTVTPLTSIFPSETASAITTYHTARTPREHGIHGWFQHVPGVDDVIEVFPFTTMDGRPMTEVHPEFTREDLFLAREHYDRTVERSVTTRKVVPEGIAAGDGRATGYADLDGFAEELGRVVDASPTPSVTFAYLPQIDAAAHEVGTEAAEYREA